MRSATEADRSTGDEDIAFNDDGGDFDAVVGGTNTGAGNLRVSWAVTCDCLFGLKYDVIGDIFVCVGDRE